MTGESESPPSRRALSTADLCLLAVFKRASSEEGYVIGSDEDISDVVASLLDHAGFAQDPAWQLGSEGRWYLEEVASYTDRLASLNWATADSPYRFTADGYHRCARLVEETFASHSGLKDLAEAVDFDLEESLQRALTNK